MQEMPRLNLRGQDRQQQSERQDSKPELTWRGRSLDGARAPASRTRTPRLPCRRCEGCRQGFGVSAGRTGSALHGAEASLSERRPEPIVELIVLREGSDDERQRRAASGAFSAKEVNLRRV